ncbi:MAG TPA: hypothetical protein VMH85_02725 [Terriglobales bacterium]|nr:hypothetical protein [Terriglobales bacterium]
MHGVTKNPSPHEESKSRYDNAGAEFTGSFAPSQAATPPAISLTRSNPGVDATPSLAG